MGIFPKIGVGPIRFGMTMDQVRDLWGQPEHIESFIASKHKPEERSIEWMYDKGVQLSFSHDDQFILGCITLTDKSQTLYGLPIIGITEHELTGYFAELELEDDLGDNGRNFILSDRELSIWVVDGIVDNITLFPEYDETGETPIWPIG